MDKPESRETEDELAMHLAETTDLSPKQARDLIKRYGNDREKLMKEARNFKAEG